MASLDDLVTALLLVRHQQPRLRKATVLGFNPMLTQITLLIDGTGLCRADIPWRPGTEPGYVQPGPQDGPSGSESQNPDSSLTTERSEVSVFEGGDF